MIKETQIFSTLDLYLSAFLFLNGFEPNLEKNNGKVIFTFPATGELAKAILLFNSNVDVSVADYVTVIKRLRAQMLSMR